MMCIALRKIIAGNAPAIIIEAAINTTVASSIAN
jgi:hypothetical protein